MNEKFDIFWEGCVGSAKSQSKGNVDLDNPDQPTAFSMRDLKEIIQIAFESGQDAGK